MRIKNEMKPMSLSEMRMRNVVGFKESGVTHR